MEIKFHKNFKKKFDRIPQKIQEQFYERLALFLQDKFHKTLNNHSVDKAFPGCRSINVGGDCRAIFQERADLAIFITIGTHSELY